MADQNELLDGITSAIQNAHGNSVDTKPITDALATSNEKFDGIHEVINDKVITELQTLSTTELDILKQLKDIIPGIQPLIDGIEYLNAIGDDISEDVKGLTDTPEANKQAKKVMNDADVAKLPAKYAAGSLMLHGQLATLFKSQDNILKDVLGSNNNIRDLIKSQLKDSAKKSSTLDKTQFTNIISSIHNIRDEIENLPNTLVGSIDSLRSSLEINLGQLQKDLQGSGNLEQLMYDSNLWFQDIFYQLEYINTDMINHMDRIEQLIGNQGGSGQGTDILKSLGLKNDDLKKLCDNIIKITKKIESFKDTPGGKAKKEKAGGSESSGGGGRGAVPLNGMTGLKEFTSEGIEAFKNTLKLTAIIIACVPTAALAIPALWVVTKFLKHLWGIGSEDPTKKPPSAEDWDNFKNKFSEHINPALEVIKKTMKLLVVITALSTSLITIGLTATLGILVMRLFFGVLGKFVKMVIDFGKQHLDSFSDTVDKIGAAFIKLTIAMILISIMPLIILPAMFGLLALVLFIMTLSLVGRLLGLKVFQKGLDNIKDTALKIALTFLVFCIALVVIGIIMPKLLGPETFLAIAGVILLFGLFLIVGALASRASGDLKKFALASILLTVALIVFALALVVIKFIYFKFLSDEVVQLAILKVVAVFLGFILVAAIASRVANQILKFAIASILLCIALVVFGLALLFLKFVVEQLKDPAIIIGIAIIIGVFVLLMALGAIASVAAPHIVMFMVASILLGVALIVLGIAILVLLHVSSRLVKEWKTLAAGLGIIMLMFVGLAIAGITAIPAIPALIILAVAGIALLVASVILMVGLTFLWIVLSLLKEIEITMVFEIAALFVFLSIVGLAAGLAIIPLGLLLVSSVLFAVSMGLLLVGLIALKGIQKKIEELEGIDGIKKAIDSAIAIFEPFKKVQLIGELAIATIGLAAFTAASILVATSFTSLQTAYNAIKDIQEIQSKVDPKPVIDLMKDLVSMVAEAGKDMKGKSKEAAQNFTLALKSITDTMLDVINIIKEMAFFQTGEGQNLITDSIDGLTKVTGFIKDNIVTGLADSLKGINKEQLNAAMALAPITEAIGNIVRLIKDIKEIKSEDVESAKGIIGQTITLFTSSKEDGDGPVLILMKSLKKMPDVTEMLGKVDAAAGLIEKFPQLISNIKQLENPGEEKIEVVKELAALFDKGGLIRGDPGAIFLTLKSLKSMVDPNTVKEKFDNSVAFISNLNNVIDSIKGLSATVEDISSKGLVITELSTFISKPFNNLLKNISKLKDLSAIKEQLSYTIEISNKLIELSDSLNSITAVGTSIQENIIDPLNKLSGAAKNVDQLSDSFKKLNSSLDGMTKGNRNIIETLGKIADGAILTIKFKEEKAASDKNSGPDPLVAIATDVGQILVAMKSDATPSWSGV